MRQICESERENGGNDDAERERTSESEIEDLGAQLDKACASRPLDRAQHGMTRRTAATHLLTAVLWLVAAVIQQYDTREVLMVGYMNDEALRRTLTTGRVTFWSRSRQEYWRKGDTSGHVQYVKGVSLDCDGDALLVEVDQVGAACHTGKRSCFLEGGPLPVVEGHRPAEQ